MDGKSLSSVVEKKSDAVAAPVSGLPSKSESSRNEEAMVVTEIACDHKDAKKLRKKTTKSSLPADKARTTSERRASTQDVEIRKNTKRQMGDRNADCLTGQKRLSLATEMPPDSENLKSRNFMTTQAKMEKLPEPPDTAEDDVEPDSPIVPVSRRRGSLAADSASKTDAASSPAVKYVDIGDAKHKKSRKKMQRVVPRSLHGKKSRSVSSRKRSTEG